MKILFLISFKKTYDSTKKLYKKRIRIIKGITTQNSWENKVLGKKSRNKFGRGVLLMNKDYILPISIVN